MIWDAAGLGMGALLGWIVGGPLVAMVARLRGPGDRPGGPGGRPGAALGPAVARARLRARLGRRAGL